MYILLTPADIAAKGAGQPGALRGASQLDAWEPECQFSSQMAKGIVLFLLLIALRQMLCDICRLMQLPEISRQYVH